MASLISQTVSRIISVGNAIDDDDIQDLASPLLLLSHEHIRSLIKPALETFVNRLVEQATSSGMSPQVVRLSVQCQHRLQELYYLALLAVDLLSLRKKQATALEQVYHLERTTKSQQVLRNVADAVLLPYVDAKFQQCLDELPTLTRLE